MITKNTPELFVAEERPWVTGVAIAAFILFFTGTGMLILAGGDWTGLVGLVVGLGIGGFLFVLFVRRVQLVMVRATGTAELRARSVFGTERTRLLVSDLAAEVETHRDSDGDTYRAVLATPHARHPLSLVFTDRPTHAALAAAINAWLESAA